MVVRIVFDTEKYAVNVIDSRINSQEWLKKVEDAVMKLLDGSVEVRHTILEDGGLHLVMDD